MIGVETPVFEVDMNSVRDDNRITTLLRHGSTFPLLPRVEAGDWVKVADEDGNIWAALVDDVRGQRLDLKIDWDQWLPPVQVRRWLRPGQEPASTLVRS